MTTWLRIKIIRNIDCVDLRTSYSGRPDQIRATGRNIGSPSGPWQFIELIYCCSKWRRRQRVRQRRRLVKRFYRESRESHIELMNDFLHFVQQSLKCWLQEEIFILIRASLILHCFHPQCCHLVTGVDKWSSTYKTKLEMLTPGASSRDINSVTRWIVCSFNIRPFTKTKKSTYL